MIKSMSGSGLIFAAFSLLDNSVSISEFALKNCKNKYASLTLVLPTAKFLRLFIGQVCFYLGLYLNKYLHSMTTLP
jgi:hypothetical protein